MLENMTELERSYMLIALTHAPVINVDTVFPLKYRVSTRIDQRNSVAPVVSMPVAKKCALSAGVKWVFPKKS